MQPWRAPHPWRRTAQAQTPTGAYRGQLNTCQRGRVSAQSGQDVREPPARADAKASAPASGILPQSEPWPASAKVECTPQQAGHSTQRMRHHDGSNDIRHVSSQDGCSPGRSFRSRLRCRSRIGGLEPREHRIPRPRALLRRHVPDARTQESACERVPTPPRHRRGSRSHLPARHVLRRRQDPWTDCVDARSAWSTERGEYRRVRRSISSTGRTGTDCGLRRGKRRSSQRAEHGGGHTGVHAVGRNRLRPRREKGLRAGTRERREPRCARSRCASSSLGSRR